MGGCMENSKNNLQRIKSFKDLRVEPLPCLEHEFPRQDGREMKRIQTQPNLHQFSEKEDFLRQSEKENAQMMKIISLDEYELVKKMIAQRLNHPIKLNLAGTSNQETKNEIQRNKDEQILQNKKGKNEANIINFFVESREGLTYSQSFRKNIEENPEKFIQNNSSAEKKKQAKQSKEEKSSGTQEILQQQSLKYPKYIQREEEKQVMEKSNDEKIEKLSNIYIDEVPRYNETKIKIDLQENNPQLF